MGCARILSIGNGEGNVSIRFVIGEVGTGRAELIRGSDKGGTGSPLMIGSVGKGRLLMIEGGYRVGPGSPVSVGSTGMGSPVSDGSQRPSERRKQTRSLQPNGRLVTAVGAGPFKRLNERSTQSRESHLRVAVEDVDSVRVAGVDGVVPVAGVVRGIEVPVFPVSVCVGFKDGSGGGETTGGGSCHGIPGLNIGIGQGSIHGFLGFTGDIGPGSIHGSLGFTGGIGGGGSQGL